MDILFTGNLAPFSKKCLQKIGKNANCVLVCEQEYSHIKEDKNTYVLTKNDELGFNHICSTYHFQTIVYFSQVLDGAVDMFGELESLEHALRLCAKHKIHNFVYVTSNESFEGGRDIKQSGKPILLDACEQLIASYESNHAIKMTTLYVPYLYSLERTQSKLYEWFNQAANQSIMMNGKRNAHADFLCEEDFCEFLQRLLLDKEMGSHREFVLSGNNDYTLEELSKEIKQGFERATVSFKKENQVVFTRQDNGEAKRVYGWHPSHILKNDLATIASNVSKKTGTKKKEESAASNQYVEKIRKLLEVVFLFFIATGLDYYTKDNVLVSFLDFRFLFIVLMGLTNGLFAGALAAVLSCVGYVWERMGVTHWQVLFYNVQNWLPFAYYMLMGVMAGYIKEKKDSQIQFTKDELKVLEDKYIFLNEQYVTTVKNKEHFNNQIISYQDSYGKLYAAVKRLNSTMMDGVCYEAVNVIEDLLENDSVAIYSVNEHSDYARLNVCSKRIHNEMAKSLRMSKYPKMMALLNNNQSYTNTECVAGYPEYATPIYKGNTLVGMILIVHATDDQMNMEFSNKFTILSDLIKDSLIRAMEYDDTSKHCIEGTSIINADKFKEILAVKEQMRKKEYLEYTLLELHKTKESLVEFGNHVTEIVRASDMLGMGEEGQIYLLLSQTNQNDIELIRDRMNLFNISFEVVV